MILTLGRKTTLQRKDQKHKAQHGQDSPDDDIELAASRLYRSLDAAK